MIADIIKKDYIFEFQFVAPDKSITTLSESEAQYVIQEKSNIIIYVKIPSSWRRMSNRTLVMKHRENKHPQVILLRVLLDAHSRLDMIRLPEYLTELKPIYEFNKIKHNSDSNIITHEKEFYSTVERISTRDHIYSILR